MIITAIAAQPRYLFLLCSRLDMASCFNRVSRIILGRLSCSFSSETAEGAALAPSALKASAFLEPLSAPCATPSDPPCALLLSPRFLSAFSAFSPESACIKFKRANFSVTSTSFLLNFH